MLSADAGFHLEAMLITGAQTPLSDQRRRNTGPWRSQRLPELANLLKDGWGGQVGERRESPELMRVNDDVRGWSRCGRVVGVVVLPCMWVQEAVYETLVKLEGGVGEVSAHHG